MKITRISKGRRRGIVALAKATVKDYGKKMLELVNAAEEILEEERIHVARITNGGQSLDNDFRQEFNQEYSQLIRTLEFAHTLADLMAKGNKESWKDAKENGIGRKKFGKKRFADPLEYDASKFPAPPSSPSTGFTGTVGKAPKKSPSKTDPDDISGLATPTSRPIPHPKQTTRLRPGDTGKARGGKSVNIEKIVDLHPNTIDKYTREARHIIDKEFSFEDIFRHKEIKYLIDAFAVFLVARGIDVSGPKKASTTITASAQDLNDVLKGIYPINKVDINESSFDFDSFLSEVNRVVNGIMETFRGMREDPDKIKSVLSTILYYTGVTAGGDPRNDVYRKLRDLAQRKVANDKSMETAAWTEINRLIKMAAAIDIQKNREKILKNYENFMVLNDRTIEIQKAFVYYVGTLASVVKEAYIRVEAANQESPDETLSSIIDGLKWMGRLVENMQQRGNGAVKKWEEIKNSGLNKMTADEMKNLIDSNDNNLIDIEEFFEASTELAEKGTVDGVVPESVKKEEDKGGEAAGASDAATVEPSAEKGKDEGEAVDIEAMKAELDGMISRAKEVGEANFGGIPLYMLAEKVRDFISDIVSKSLSNPLIKSLVSTMEIDQSAMESLGTEEKIRHLAAEINSISSDAGKRKVEIIAPYQRNGEVLPGYMEKTPYLDSIKTELSGYISAKSKEEPATVDEKAPESGEDAAVKEAPATEDVDAAKEVITINEPVDEAPPTSQDMETYLESTKASLDMLISYATGAMSEPNLSLINPREKNIFGIFWNSMAKVNGNAPRESGEVVRVLENMKKRISRENTKYLGDDVVQKALNDQGASESGDNVIAKIIQMIKSSTRPDDQAGAVEGDIVGGEQQQTQQENIPS